jgi:aspartate/methionine/tyrosine aminotransferase
VISYKNWHPSELMDYAKNTLGGGSYNLTRSSVPSYKELSDLPGGPFNFKLWGKNFYGHEGLRAAIASWYGAQESNILIAQGASQSNFLIAGAALADGGTAVVEIPVYQPILRAAEMFADRVVRVPRRKENHYQPDPHELLARLTPDTRLVCLTNLHNPSGIEMDNDTLKEIVTIADSMGAVVLIDEVYLPMIERNFRKHGFSRGAISTNSLNKSWGLESIRVGWAAGPAELIKRAYSLNNIMGVNQPYGTEDLACQIVNSKVTMDYMIEQANIALQNRDILDDFLNNTQEISCIRPSGGINAILELPSGMDDRLFTHRLLETKDTSVFPGSFFEQPGSIRVSFGYDRAEMTEGLKRIAELVRENG